MNCMAVENISKLFSLSVTRSHPFFFHTTVINDQKKFLLGIQTATKANLWYGKKRAWKMVYGQGYTWKITIKISHYKLNERERKTKNKWVCTSHQYTLIKILCDCAGNMMHPCTVPKERKTEWQINDLNFQWNSKER